MTFLKKLIKFLFFSIFGAIFLSSVFYFSSFYPKYIKSQLSKRILPQLNNYLDESYLYEKSNLDRLNIRFGGCVNVKLKRKSVYNPDDTQKLFYSFTDKYYTLMDTLPIIFYPLKKMEIKFYIKDAEKSGPVFHFSKGKIINEYTDVRESIIKFDRETSYNEQQKTLNNKKQEKEKRLAHKAFGFINFGDFVKDVQIKFEEDPRVRVNQLMIDNPTYEVVMGSYRYRMKPIYHQNKLYMLNFVSAGFWPNQYKKEFKKSWEDIVDFYSQIYGKIQSEFLDQASLKNDYIEWTSEWDLDKKKIQIGLSRNEGLFYTVIWISHEDYKIDNN